MIITFLKVTKCDLVENIIVVVFFTLSLLASCDVEIEINIETKIETKKVCFHKVSLGINTVVQCSSYSLFCTFVSRNKQQVLNNGLVVHHNLILRNASCINLKYC